MCPQPQRRGETAFVSRPWEPLVTAVQNQDPDSIHEFRRAFQDGIRFFIRRELPASYIEDDVRQCLDTAIASIQHGALRDPAGLPDFICGITKRHIANRLNATGAPRDGVAQGQAAKTVSSEGRAVALRVLTQFTHRERAILQKYYGGNQSELMICRELHVKMEEIERVRIRARGLFVEGLCAARYSGQGIGRERRMALGRSD